MDLGFGGESAELLPLEEDVEIRGYAYPPVFDLPEELLPTPAAEEEARRAREIGGVYAMVPTPGKNEIQMWKVREMMQTIDGDVHLVLVDPGQTWHRVPIEGEGSEAAGNVSALRVAYSEWDRDRKRFRSEQVTRARKAIRKRQREEKRRRRAMDRGTPPRGGRR